VRFATLKDSSQSTSIRFTAYVDGVIRRYGWPDDEGERAATLISRLAGLRDDVARLVTNVVHADEAPGQSFYDYGPLTLGSGGWLQEDADRWEEFKRIVRHDGRFFKPETRTILDRIFADIAIFYRGAAIRQLTADTIVFRGRLAESYRQAFGWFESAEPNLAAPPNEKSTAGRMNPAGVRVFYGALQERIAVAELRPPIGSYVVLGSFVPTQPLRILDLGSLGNVFEYEDLFSVNFEKVATRLTFLRMLEQEISSPVQPHDQTLDYIPTQLVAEYVRFVLGLDGIAYRSAQSGEAPAPGQIHGAPLPANERNVALFGSAALTILDQVPEGVMPGLRFVPDSQQLFEI
jgi:hypothetical protein